MRLYTATISHICTCACIVYAELEKVHVTEVNDTCTYNTTICTCNTVIVSLHIHIVCMYTQMYIVYC